MTPSYERYGARGIEFRFSSVNAATHWVSENLGIPKNAESMELDRIDNNKHYEPGESEVGLAFSKYEQLQESGWAEQGKGL